MTDIYADIRRVRTIAADHAAILSDADKDAIASVCLTAHQHQQAMLGIHQLLTALGYGTAIEAFAKMYQDATHGDPGDEHHPPKSA